MTTETLLDLLPAYRATLVARGYRPRGIVKYIDQLRAFARALPMDTLAATVTTETITRYQEQLATRCASGTVGNALRLFARSVAGASAVVSAPTTQRCPFSGRRFANPPRARCASPSYDTFSIYCRSRKG